VAGDGEALHAMMEPVEARGLELAQAIGNHAAPGSQPRVEPVVEVDVEAVGQEMAAAEPLRVRNQIIDIEADCSIICGDHGAGADADDCVNRNFMTDQLSQHTDVRGAPQAARAQHHRDPNPIRSAVHSDISIVARSQTSSS
jgi:hypothetical protein